MSLSSFVVSHLTSKITEKELKKRWGLFEGQSDGGRVRQKYFYRKRKNITKNIFAKNISTKNIFVKNIFMIG